jgi:hypothetical protein
MRHDLPSFCFWVINRFFAQTLFSWHIRFDFQNLFFGPNDLPPDSPIVCGT